MKKIGSIGMGNKNYMSEILKKYGKEKEESGIPFDEKRTFNCQGVCESCQEFACPNNLTRCQ